MAASVFPPVPGALKKIEHYLKTATEHDQRDPVVAYWCRLFALQSGMKIDRKSKESVALLTALMDWLEKQKQVHRDNEAITNEVAAQAHIENHALKLFLWADTEDRASRFNKNVVKAFYTAGMLYDILVTFGELTEEVVHHRKYAKWKAAYIHNCLKNGETPMAGPIQGEEDSYDAFLEGLGLSQATGGAPDIVVGDPYSNPSTSSYGTADYSAAGSPASNARGATFSGTDMSSSGLEAPGIHAPPSTPAERSSNSSSTDSTGSNTATGKPKLNAEELNKAQKYCKWASSALQYEDVDTAVTNLQKAIRLLTTGADD